MNPDIKVPIIPLTSDILLNHKEIKLYIYLFYINEMPLLHTKKSKIIFLTEENLNSRSADKIIQELDTVDNIYTESGFNINIYHRDNEFDINDLREHIRPESLNICARICQIPIIERYIETINKGVR